MRPVRACVDSASARAPTASGVNRTTAAGFPEGPVATTADTLYFGFGFEGITDEADRNEVMGRAISHLRSSQT